jgi:thiaminase/transcriptional activator TenA
VWDGLITHPFVLGLADATLPPEAFRFYVTQNILYLGEYTRSLALGLAKTNDEDLLVRFADSVQNIAAVELPQNRKLLASIDALCPSPAPATDAEPAPGMVAYSSWLLATASRGSAIDVLTAAMPCAWSYGEIGRTLAPNLTQHPVYTDWIGFFASDTYTEMVAGLRGELDSLVAACDARERSRLVSVFRMACRMENRFWDMGWNREQWADLAVGE